MYMNNKNFWIFQVKFLCKKLYSIKWRNLSQTGKIGSGKITKTFFQIFDIWWSSLDITDDFKLISRTVIFRLSEINNIMFFSFVKFFFSLFLVRYYKSNYKEKNHFFFFFKIFFFTFFSSLLHIEL